MVFPVSIGGGLRLFPDSRTKTALQLTETTDVPERVVAQHVYVPA